jgi:GT2 family glycosyltransferase
MPASDCDRVLSGDHDNAQLAAVVVNFNGGVKLRNALACLCNQTYPLSRVVVVDNGSSDGSADSIDRLDPRIEVLRLGANTGLSAARNAGLKSVDSERVLLCDNDICLARTGLERLVTAARAAGAAVACPRIIYHPGRDVIQTDGAANHFLGVMSMRRPDTPVAGAVGERTAVDSAIGACYLLDRRIVLASGGFNELYFFYFEDLEFALRVRGRGHSIVFDSEAVAYHDRGSGTPGLSFRGAGEYPRRRAELSMRNRWLTILLHDETRTLLVLGPALLVYEIANVGYCLMRGWLPEWFAAWRWLVRHRGRILETRRENLRMRTIGDRELLSGGPIPFAKGAVSGRLAGCLAAVLSAVLNGYWCLVRGLLRGAPDGAESMIRDGRPR